MVEITGQHTFPFKLNQKVKISKFDVIGYLNSIHLLNDGSCKFEVEYKSNTGAVCQQWVFAYEIEAVE